MPQLCSAMQQAAKLEAEKAERYREFTLGKYAYGKGQYQSSLQLFTAALDREGPFSPMGGEVQLWLALAYQVQTSPRAISQSVFFGTLWADGRRISLTEA